MAKTVTIWRPLSDETGQRIAQRLIARLTVDQGLRLASELQAEFETRRDCLEDPIKTWLNYLAGRPGPRSTKLGQTLVEQSIVRRWIRDTYDGLTQLLNGHPDLSASDLSDALVQHCRTTLGRGRLSEPSDNATGPDFAAAIQSEVSSVLTTPKAIHSRAVELLQFCLDLLGYSVSTERIRQIVRQ